MRPPWKVSHIILSENNMSDFEDPLDLLNDDGDGVVEISLVEEEEERQKGTKNQKSGCCVVFLILSPSLILAGWCVRELLI